MKRKCIKSKDYPKKCEYCIHGRISPNGENILCEKKGIVGLDSLCHSYKYDVLKRVPQKKAVILKADPDDFKL